MIKGVSLTVDCEVSSAAKLPDGKLNNRVVLSYPKTETEGGYFEVYLDGERFFEAGKKYNVVITEATAEQPRQSTDKP